MGKVKEFYDTSNLLCTGCGQTMVLDELRDAKIKVLYCMVPHCVEHMKIYEAPKIRLLRL